MVMVEAFLLVGFLAGAGETVLLDFSAEWCAPCRKMEPVVARLQADGVPVRRINIDREPQIARQYHVVSIPCFVMLVDGREVNRVNGLTNYDQLRQMVAGASHGTGPSGPVANSLGSLAVERALDSPLTSPLPSAVAATVRLKIDEGGGSSFGSGTIVDVHGEEALILTCGHIFRDSDGRGKILVDFYVNEGRRTVPGQLVRFDLERDLGLVSIQPGIPVRPMRVASRENKLNIGQKVLVTGCDRGGQPICEETQIVSIDRYQGAPNVTVAGQPVDGRSGGGLFTLDGRLIGVCNAADPLDREGLYVALPAIQDEFDRAGLSFVYTGSGFPTAVDREAPHLLVANESEQLVQSLPRKTITANPTVSPLQEGNDSLSRPATPDFSHGKETSGNGPSDPLGIRLQDAEIICIIRTPGDAHKKSEVFVLNDASPRLIQQLAIEMQKRNSLQTTLPMIRPSSQPSGQSTEVSSFEGIFRGQSTR